MTNFIDEDSGLPIEVVEPGSENDPFTVRGSNRPSAPSPTPTPVPVVETPESVATTVEGKEPAPTPAQPSPPQQPTTPANPVVEPSTPAVPARELTPLEKAVQEGKLDEYIAGAAREAAEQARRAAQSAADKATQAIRDQLREEREARLKQEREAKLNNPDLTEEEREILTEKFKLDDERAALQEWEDALESYHKEQLIVDLLREKAQFGVTESQLREFDDPDEMTAFADQAELAFYRSGKTLTTEVPSRAPEAPSTPGASPHSVPAGATAPTDLPGEQPVNAPPPRFNPGLGTDAMAENLKNSEWVTLSMPA